MEKTTDQNEVDLAELNEEKFQQWLQNKYPGRTVRREGDKIVVSIPVKFYRRNGRQMVFSTNDGAEESESHALVVALAKAWQWQEELESGEYSTIEELAGANNVDRTYVSRLLQLTALAPELVNILLAGDDRERLSLRQLRKAIPVLWSEQLQLWGNESLIK